MRDKGRGHMKEQADREREELGVTAQEAAFEAGVTLGSSICGCQTSLSCSLCLPKQERRPPSTLFHLSGCRVSGLLGTMFQSGNVA